MKIAFLFLVVLLVRVFNAFTIRTYFQPDEFYQALEPAHKLVYGYGYITWEWREKLRSAMHPLLYAAAYKLGNFVGEDASVYAAPKLVGAIVAALNDVFVFKFAKTYLNALVARVALLCSLLSSWNWFVSTRSFSNNLELLLTTIGLSFWPWRGGGFGVATFFGFLLCFVRPTNALLWGYLGATRLFSAKWAPIFILFAAAMAVSTVCDYLYYGEWTFSVANFIKFNVVRNLLIFYGEAPWHFYLFQGIPLMTMGYLPYLLRGAWRNRRSLLVRASLFVITGFSLIKHKEFRFIQPLYPIFLLLVAREIKKWRYVVLLHAATAYFFTRINESGEIAVIERLRSDPIHSVGFLTPCHSTPWHSSLHRDIDMWFLTCEPPLHLEKGTLENIKSYRDELDLFFDDPIGFMRDTFPLPGSVDAKKRPWPQRIVVFEPHREIVSGYLEGHYRECDRLFNSYFHWDARRRGDIFVYCLL